MTSICENHHGLPIRFHVLTMELSSKREKKLREIANKYGNHFFVYKISSLKFDSFPVSDHINLSAYNRLLIPLLLPNTVSKCLYMDSDMVVDGSLQELFEVDLSGYALGAVVDQSVDDIRHYNRLNYPSSKPYFNSGLLLLNLNMWRELDLTNRILKYIVDNKSVIRFHDQDALNAVLHDMVLYLPLRYNVQYSFFLKNPMISRKYWDELHLAVRNPVVIHFTNKVKPWHRNCLNPYRYKYTQYNDLSLWPCGRLKSSSLSYDLHFFLKKAFYIVFRHRRFVLPTILDGNCVGR